MKASNAKAIREALEAFVEYSELVCKMGMFNRDRLVAITTKARAALAAPPCNCYVGTADEQAQRYDKFCEETDCVKCPVRALWHHYFDICKNRKVSCGLIWAQMPYEEGAGK